MESICFQHLASVNFVAVFVAAIAHFFLGSLWFSVLFGRIWVKQLAKHHIIIKPPKQATMMLKMGLTFLGSFIASLAMALLIHMTGVATLCSALHLGFVVAIGFVVAAMGTSYIWVNKSIKLSLINIGYPALGAVVAAIILALWQ